MAAFGVATTKGVTWRGVQEEFSNLYHYDLASPIDTDAGWDSLVDQIVAIEKLIFGTEVTFLRARVFGPTYEARDETPQKKEASIMRFAKDLSGTGSLNSVAKIAHEQTVCAQFYVGRSPRGYKVFLRKYFHSCDLGSTTETATALRGSTTLSTAGRAKFVDAMNSLKTISVGGFANDLSTPGGRHLPLGSTPFVHPYLRTRQFKQ